MIQLDFAELTALPGQGRTSLDGEDGANNLVGEGEEERRNLLTRQSCLSHVLTARQARKDTYRFAGLVPRGTGATAQGGGGGARGATVPRQIGRCTGTHAGCAPVVLVRHPRAARRGRTTSRSCHSVSLCMLRNE